MCKEHGEDEDNAADAADDGDGHPFIRARYKVLSL